MRKHNAKKLSLDTTILRNLDVQELAPIAGGGSKALCGQSDGCTVRSHQSVCPK